MGSHNQVMALSVEHLTKAYRIYNNPIAGPILDRFQFWSDRKRFREFVALKDVSFQVRKGEVVGLVGPNGCGKTTLLKCVAGLLPISAGRIEVKGRVTALLALGVGIHPEMSGRENIYYSGILLGMAPEEVARKTDSIIDFAEIGQYIDQPLRTYSSGMRARLLFSISMSIDPDILIIDEALATGDAYFLNKSARRIRALCESGATILFVSHNLRQVVDLCDRALLMSQGRIIEDGRPEDIVSAYNRTVIDREVSRLPVVDVQSLPIVSGFGQVVLVDAFLRSGEGGECVKAVRSGDDVELVLNFARNDRTITAFHIFVGFLQGEAEHYVGSYNSEASGVLSSSKPVTVEKNDGELVIKWSPLLLTTNDYSLWIILYHEGRTFSEYRGISPFFVHRSDDVTDRFGYFWQPGTLSYERRGECQ